MIYVAVLVKEYRFFICQVWYTGTVKDWDMGTFCTYTFSPRKGQSIRLSFLIGQTER